MKTFSIQTLLIVFFVDVEYVFNIISFLLIVLLVKKTVEDLAVIPRDSPSQPEHGSIEDVTPGLERTKDKANDSKLEPESDGKVDTDNKYKKKTSKK